MKRVLVIVGILGGFALVIVLGALIWLKSLWTDVYSKAQLDDLVEQARMAPALPLNFTSTVVTIHPKIFSNGSVAHFVDQLLDEAKYTVCPCREVGYMTYPDHKQMKRGLHVFYTPSFVLALEKEVSQAQCFALYLDHFDFTRGIHGVQNASLAYIGDSLATLNMDQRIELIVMLKNPVAYQKDRRPDLFNSEFDRMKAKVCAAIPRGVSNL